MTLKESHLIREMPKYHLRKTCNPFRSDVFILCLVKKRMPKLAA
jgi:hypothetical protein